MFAGTAGPGVGALEKQMRAGAESLLSVQFFSLIAAVQNLIFRYLQNVRKLLVTCFLRLLK